MEKADVSYQRRISFTSQSCLILVSFFWQYIHFWSTAFGDEVLEEKNKIKNSWWEPWGLTKNCSHFHRTRHWCISFAKTGLNVSLDLYFCCPLFFMFQLKKKKKRNFIVSLLLYICCITYLIHGSRRFHFTQWSPGKQKNWTPMYKKDNVEGSNFPGAIISNKFPEIAAYF